MLKKTFVLSDDSATHAFGEMLGKELKAPLLLGFSGEIGTGKTTMIRSVLRTLGVTSAIKSPSFTLVESYETENTVIHHFDLYRIQHETELQDIGWSDYCSPASIILVEWPEHAKKLLEAVDLSFTLSFASRGRLLLVTVKTDAGQVLFNKILDKKW